MRRAPLPLHLTTGSFSLRAADKAGVTRTRTGANDLVTVSRGIRVPLDSAAAGLPPCGPTRSSTTTPSSPLDRRRGCSAPRRVNVVGHQLTFLPDEVVELDGVRLTSPARTWLDLATVPGAESPPETRLRLALIRAGLPEPVLNHVVRGPAGAPVLWPDAAYPQRRIALQYEGAHHNGEDQYLRDIRRADIAALAGWLEVRISRLDLAGGSSAAAISKVRAALESRGWRAR